ncbi:MULTISPECIES: hypothetical protein [unclassified Sporosarcina]|nr:MULTISPECIES: hypothetical protein [unclassified Sporosarcina]
MAYCRGMAIERLPKSYERIGGVIERSRRVNERVDTGYERLTGSMSG